MIVVTIIGLLAAVALPNFARHRNSTRNSTRVKSCISNLRVLSAAKSQWALENNGSSTSRPSATDLMAYLRDHRMPECPADGTYRIRNVSRYPLCSLYPDGHALTNRNGDDDRALD